MQVDIEIKSNEDEKKSINLLEFKLKTEKISSQIGNGPSSSRSHTSLSPAATSKDERTNRHAVPVKTFLIKAPAKAASSTSNSPASRRGTIPGESLNRVRRGLLRPRHQEAQAGFVPYLVQHPGRRGHGRTGDPREVGLRDRLVGGPRSLRPCRQGRRPPGAGSCPPAVPHPGAARSIAGSPGRDPRSGQGVWGGAGRSSRGYRAERGLRGGVRPPP